MKKSKNRITHIAIIILGIIFVCISGFHTNTWFDEAYSVGMANHTMSEIWTIGGNDVHPILYYWMLRIVSLITGGSILAYRIFSMIPIAILGLIGFTHIRKDFGEKTGLLFSFLVYLLPQTAVYANEIRMYSWAVLTVTLLAIYAYRLTKDNSNKNWAIFFISSIMSIYLHYYGLMAAGIINVILLIYLIVKKRKKDIIKILIFGIIQAVSYIPWLMYFVSQLGKMTKGFWIGFEFPKTVIELMSFQFIGNLSYKIPFIISVIIYIFLFIKAILLNKKKEDILPIKLSFGIYILVILAAIIMTFILKTSIVYYRYLFVITGLYIFTISYILGKEKNNLIVILICIVIGMLGCINNIKLVRENYDESNKKIFTYFNENIKENDYIVYNQIGSASTSSIYADNQNQYFYNPENWGVEEAYKAFAPQMTVVINEDFLQDISGRIWIVDDWNKTLYNKLFNNNKYKLIKEDFIETKYHGYNYNMILIERIK